MSNQSIFIIRFKPKVPAHLVEHYGQSHGYVPARAGYLTTDVNKARRFTMREANDWIHSNKGNYIVVGCSGYKPKDWMVEYAPLCEGVAV